MEEKTTEQALTDFDATEVENKPSCEEKEETSLGKFKDVSSLLSAYNSLQSEFTKRCQKIKELEGVIADNSKKPAESGEAEPSLSEKAKEEIIKDYLKEILFLKKDAIVMDGSGVTVKTPENRPKTIEEAGKLVRKFMAEND